MDRPTLFSAPMVRALLAGTKTQTRRVVKPQPIPATTEVGTFHHPDDDDGRGPRYWSGGPDPENPGYSYIQPDWAIPCPYGQPGNRLWVRENFRPIYPQDLTYNNGQPIEYDYAATYKHGDRLGDFLGIKPKWKPSIHMPRAASRITLEITGVRVERLQDITADDSMAEGIVRLPDGGYAADTDGRHYHAASAWYSYGSLWEAINGPGSWEANPWVWVVEFKRVKP